MSNFKLTTDAEGVREFREIRRKHRESGIPNPDTSGNVGGRHIVVELSVEVQAGDFNPVQCRQVKLVNGVWEVVRTVSVRILSGYPIVATSEAPQRCVAEHLGSSGYCCDPNRDILVKLTSDLECATTGLEEDLPSATAKVIVTTPEGPDVCGDTELTLYNRGRFVSYEKGMIGFTKSLLRKPLFLPLDCPDPDSSSWGSSC